MQTNLQNQLFHELRRRNVYINQPDNFFLQGGSRTGMGYDESQYSLPRWIDLSISRQGMYDDLYALAPTQGWMFVPIDDYHGGGENAAFAPNGHFQQQAYNFALGQYMGAGTAACYRGAALYDNDDTKAIVTKWVNFYKKHRQTLISPIVSHVIQGSHMAIALASAEFRI